jgi:hypothetical protein
MSMKKRIDVLYFIPACLFCPWLWIQIVPAPVPTLISWMGLAWAIGLAMFVGTGVLLSQKIWSSFSCSFLSQ